MAVVENFEKLLTDFFSLYHPRQVAKVGAIVQEFKGQEVVALKALCNKYKKAYKVVPGLEEALAAPAPTPIIEEPVVQKPELSSDSEELANEEPSAEELAIEEENSEEEVVEEEDEKE